MPMSSVSVFQRQSEATESVWLAIGRAAETMGDLERAQKAYERVLAMNPNSWRALTQAAHVCRCREDYPRAVEYFNRAIQIDDKNGDIWSSLGHCFLMQDELHSAYTAYQNALFHLPSPKEDAKLWYGIGILYDRYGSLQHAEEAFASVLKMDPNFEKADEIYFRLGIIYKQLQRYTESLKCFDQILRNPPHPLSQMDIWFQIGHVYEQQKDYESARDAWNRVLNEAPNHAKVLQQLGWLYHQSAAPFVNQETAVSYLTRSLETDSTDAQSWYLLGRAYMTSQKYNKAYEAYQQAVYRDGRNPTFWISIGVLYFQINQFKDALDAYSRAIRLNPYISEVWFDLGSLYESCNQQIKDAMDAYIRAKELDPTNVVVKERLELLSRHMQDSSVVLGPAPAPKDVHPTAYSNFQTQPHDAPPPMRIHPNAGSGQAGGSGGGGGAPSSGRHGSPGPHGFSGAGGPLPNGAYQPAQQHSGSGGQGQRAHSRHTSPNALRYPPLPPPNDSSSGRGQHHSSSHHHGSGYPQDVEMTDARMVEGRHHRGDYAGGSRPSSASGGRSGMPSAYPGIGSHHGSSSLPPPSSITSGMGNQPPVLHHPQPQSQGGRNFDSYASGAGGGGNSARSKHSSSRRNKSPNAPSSMRPDSPSSPRHLPPPGGARNDITSGMHQPSSSAAGGDYGRYGSARYGAAGNAAGSGGGHVNGGAAGAAGGMDRPRSAGGGAPGGMMAPGDANSGPGGRGGGGGTGGGSGGGGSSASGGHYGAPVGPAGSHHHSSHHHHGGHHHEDMGWEREKRYGGDRGDRGGAAPAMVDPRESREYSEREKGPRPIKEETREKNVLLPPPPHLGGSQSQHHQQQQQQQYQGSRGGYDSRRDRAHDRRPSEDHDRQGVPASSSSGMSHPYPPSGAGNDYERDRAGGGRGRSTSSARGGDHGAPPPLVNPQQSMSSQMQQMQSQQQQGRSGGRWDPRMDEREGPLPPRQTSPFHPGPMRHPHEQRGDQRQEYYDERDPNGRYAGSDVNSRRRATRGSGGLEDESGPEKGRIGSRRGTGATQPPTPAGSVPPSSSTKKPRHSGWDYPRSPPWPNQQGAGGEYEKPQVEPGHQRYASDSNNNGYDKGYRRHHSSSSASQHPPPPTSSTQQQQPPPLVPSKPAVNSGASRYIDEDYDDSAGAADALMDLASIASGGGSGSNRLGQLNATAPATPGSSLASTAPPPSSSTKSPPAGSLSPPNVGLGTSIARPGSAMTLGRKRRRSGSGSDTDMPPLQRTFSSGDVRGAVGATDDSEPEKKKLRLDDSSANSPPSATSNGRPVLPRIQTREDEEEGQKRMDVEVASPSSISAPNTTNTVTAEEEKGRNSSPNRRSMSVTSPPPAANGKPNSKSKSNSIMSIVHERSASPSAGAEDAKTPSAGKDDEEMKRRNSVHSRSASMDQGSDTTPTKSATTNGIRKSTSPVA